MALVLALLLPSIVDALTAQGACDVLSGPTEKSVCGASMLQATRQTPLENIGTQSARDSQLTEGRSASSMPKASYYCGVGLAIEEKPPVCVELTQLFVNNTGTDYPTVTGGGNCKVENFFIHTAKLTSDEGQEAGTAEGEASYQASNRGRAYQECGSKYTIQDSVEVPYSMDNVACGCGPNSSDVTRTEMEDIYFAQDDQIPSEATNNPTIPRCGITRVTLDAYVKDGLGWGEEWGAVTFNGATWKPLPQKTVLIFNEIKQLTNDLKAGTKSAGTYVYTKTETFDTGCSVNLAVHITAQNYTAPPATSSLDKIATPETPSPTPPPTPKTKSR